MNFIKNTALVFIAMIALTIAVNFKLMLMLAGSFGLAISALCGVIVVVSVTYLILRNFKANKLQHA
jgi:hypothetical protein